MKWWAVPFTAAFACPVVGCSTATLDAVGLPHQDLAVGLIAHWTLDDGGGTVAGDESGNGHAGQLTRGAWISDGRFGGALRLGAGDSVAVPSFPAPTPSWSVSAWIRMSAGQLAADTNDMWATILSTETLSSGGWELNIDHPLGQTRFVFSYWSPPIMGYLVTDCGCVTNNSWVHLAAVVDVEANSVSLYRNGTIVHRESRPSDALPGDSTLYFGRWNMAGRLLSADLDDVAIWGRALLEAEIATLTIQSP